MTLPQPRTTSVGDLSAHIVDLEGRIAALERSSHNHGGNLTRLVGYAIGPLADQTVNATATTDLTSMSVSFAADPGRVYVTLASLLFTQRTSIGSVVLTVRDGGGNVRRENRYGSIAVNDFRTADIECLEVGQTGDQVRKLSISTTAGAVEIEGSDSRFTPKMWVLDLGPA